jgi:hypothetical protein
VTPEPPAQDPAATTIVFRDLEHAAERLRDAQPNPAELRRLLREFVNLTQQLTEVMRHEYSQLTGRKWVPSSFEGWTPTTTLFKRLRSSDYHELPFLIDARHEQIVPFAKTSTGKILAFGIQSTTEIRDPWRQDSPRSALAMYPAQGDSPLPEAERTTRFIIRGRTKEVRKALVEAGTEDVLALTESCMTSLREYFAYYQQCLSRHARGSYRP